MKIRTERSLIKEVVKRWEEQYPKGRESDKQVVLDNLKKLDLEVATKKEVDKIIGNSSWTEISCSECKKYVGWVIQLGEEPDYESSTVDICKKCFNKAIKLIKRG